VKVLLDACVWGGAVSVLRSAGHDVDWVGHWSADPGDEVILAMASERGQILVTLDKDFGELACRAGLRAPAGVVLLRLPGMPPEEVSRFITDGLATRVDWKGHFSVVTELDIRMRLLPRR